MNKKVKTILLAGSLTAMSSSCETPKNQEKNSNEPSQDSTSLVERLKKLSKTKFTKQVMPNAMCYSVAAPTEEDYECPVCGTKTPSTSYENGTIRDIRKIVKEIKSMGYDVQLDESQYCQKCKNPQDEHHELIFKIRFSKKAEYHKAYSTSYDDYDVVKHFLEGEESFKKLVDNSGQGGERYLKIVKYMTGLE